MTMIGKIPESTPTWKEESDARLDAALARFHKDWGGDKSPMEILCLGTGTCHK